MLMRAPIPALSGIKVPAVTARDARYRIQSSWVRIRPSFPFTYCCLLVMTPAETLSIAPDGHRFDAGLYRAADTAAPVLVFLSALGTPSRVYRGSGA